METRYPELLKWIWNINKSYDLGIKEYKTSLDISKQEQTWRCFGCTVEGKSSWPDWEMRLEHELGCKYIELKKLMETL